MIDLNSTIPTSFSNATQQKWKNGVLKAKMVRLPNSQPISQEQRNVLARVLGKDTSLLSRPKDCQALTAQEVNNIAMGRCIYTFNLPGIGELYECGCSHYDRIWVQPLRLNFEEKAIGQILQLAREGNNELKIALLAPGLLFSDFSWLTQAMAQLKQSGWQGTIRLNLIDERYAPAFEQTSAKFKQLNSDKQYYLMLAIIFATLGAFTGVGSFACLTKKKVTAGTITGGCSLALIALAGFYIYKSNELNEQLLPFSEDFHLKDQLRTSEAIKTFLTGLAMFSPNGIQVKSSFFRSVGAYQQECVFKEKYRNQLLIGSDLAKARSQIVPLQATTQMPNARVVVI